MLDNLKHYGWALYNRLFGIPDVGKATNVLKSILRAGHRDADEKALPKLQVCTILYPGTADTICAPDLHSFELCDLFRNQLGQGGSVLMLEGCPDGSKIVRGGA